jgi:hypothetical protein
VGLILDSFIVVDTVLFNILKSTLDKDPEERPTMEEILKMLHEVQSISIRNSSDSYIPKESQGN